LPSVQAAARALGLDLVVVKAAAERDIDAAFANVVHALPQSARPRAIGALTNLSNNQGRPK
jgi:hypothetical protein